VLQYCPKRKNTEPIFVLSGTPHIMLCLHLWCREFFGRHVDGHGASCSGTMSMHEGSARRRCCPGRDARSSEGSTRRAMRAMRRGQLNAKQGDARNHLISRHAKRLVSMLVSTDASASRLAGDGAVAPRKEALTLVDWLMHGPQGCSSICSTGHAHANSAPSLTAEAQTRTVSRLGLELCQSELRLRNASGEWPAPRQQLDRLTGMSCWAKMGRGRNTEDLFGSYCPTSQLSNAVFARSLRVAPLRGRTPHAQRH
jgi:hypothetical protein